jgi:outer membrane protein TolC
VKVAILSLTLLATGGVLTAQDAATPTEPAPLTLDQALALADQQSPDLLAARAAQESQEAKADATGRGSWWPRLSAVVDLSHTDNPARVFAEKLNRGEFGAADFDVAKLNDPGGLSHLMSSLSLEVPIDTSGRVRAAEKSERAQARSSSGLTLEAREQVRLGVVQAYRQAVLARAATDVTVRTLSAARAREADVEAHVAEGATLQADLLRTRARRRQREADLADRQEQVRVATAALERAVGAAPGTHYAPAETAQTPVPLAGTREAWVERAVAQRGAISAAQARVESAQWAGKVESRTIVPDISVYGQFQDDRGSLSSAGGQSGTVGASLRWSAFDATRSRRVAAAGAAQRAAEQAARAATDQVRLEVEAAWWRAQSARERHAAAAGGAEEGREALRIVRERRLAGMATLTDELETEAASVAAELQEIQAATDAALADAALRRAAGEL